MHNKVDSSDVSYTVIVLAKNEEKNITGLCRKFVYFCNSLAPLAIQVVFVDDGSTDKTFTLIAEALSEWAPVSNMSTVQSESDRGPGYAARCGLAAATGDFVVFWPGNDSLSLEDLRGMVMRHADSPRCRRCLGPFVTSSCSTVQMRPKWRRLISRLNTLAFNVAGGVHLAYANGTSVYPRTFLESCSDIPVGHSYSAVLSVRAARAHCVTLTVPLSAQRFSSRSRAIRLRNVRDVGFSLFSLLRAGRGARCSGFSS